MSSRSPRTIRLLLNFNSILLTNPLNNSRCTSISNISLGSTTLKHYSTTKGVLEKEDPTNPEFIVPAKLKSLIEAQDFGRYADPSDGLVHVCFLTNNDITGGNSGSPVLNAKGELIGLAFDGNWESMSSDVMFEPDLQRCICVDIRYVLFLVEKLGGASNIIAELDLAQ